MKKMKWTLFAAVGMAALVLTGCLFVPAAPTGVIEGFVVDHGAGEPVRGAVVMAYPEGGDIPLYTVGSDYYGPVAITDADGYYRLTVPEGVYTVRAEKDGHAVSVSHGIVVGSTAKLDIILKPVFNPDWSLEPPEVTLTGVDEGGVYSGPIDFRVDAQGPNDIALIYVALGKTPGSGWLTGTRQIYSSTYTTGDVTIDPADFGVEGETTFEVVVYDVNGNRTHLVRNIQVDVASGPATLDPPAAMSILAVTLGKKVEFYNEGFTVPSGAGELQIQAAPAGGNLYVELTWDASPDDAVVGGTGITGYRIYRRLAGETEYTPIGTVAQFDAVYDPDTGDFLYYLFRDSSPALQEGVMAGYRIRAYKGTTESDPVEDATTPLGSWDVRLLEPADGATGVSLTPTFRWQPTNLVGNDQYYLWVLWDLAQGLAGYYLYEDKLNETEHAFTGIPGTPFERLQPHRVYQWYIGLAVAYDDFAAPKAVSVAVNDWWTDAYPYWDMPATDLFTFTTGDW